MCFLLFALFIFNSINAILKGCDHTYHPAQVVFFRSFFALIPYALLMVRPQARQQLKVNNLTVLIGLGVLTAFSLAMLFESIVILPLADATVYMFTASLFVTMLSYPIMREQVSPGSWFAVIIGFMGVLIMANPTGAMLNVGAILGLSSSLLQAVIMLYSRKLAPINTGFAMVFYISLAGSLVTAIFLPFVWQMPTLKDWGYLIMLGVGGGIGQYFVVEAYRYANAGTLAPLLYSSMIWSFLYGVIFFDEIPSKTLYVGGGLIIAAGLLVIYFQNSKRKRLFI